MSMKNHDHQPAIRLQDLSKSFGEQKVLDRLDLEVARGETVTVLGRSGTGKSVLLKLIMGLQKPDDGEIEINGEQIAALPLDELNRVRKTVGFLFQQAALYDSLTVEENVAFPLRRHTAMKDDERQARVRELLARVGMEEALEKMPGDLSGVVAVDLDWTCPWDHCYERDGIYYACGYPRPIPGVPVENNLSGISFAVAHVTAWLAR